jgi:hypothetical protein
LENDVLKHVSSHDHRDFIGKSVKNSSAETTRNSCENDDSEQNTRFPVYLSEAIIEHVVDAPANEDWGSKVTSQSSE